MDSGFFHFANFSQQPCCFFARTVANFSQIGVKIWGVGGVDVRPVRTVITVDDRTGEVKSMDTTYVSSPKREPPYIKLYLDCIGGLRDIPLYCWPVLLCMLEKVHYANSEQCFEFGAPMRNKVADELHVKIGKVNHAISDLVKCGAILRAGRGLYQFNPMFFARGEWKDIQKLRSFGQ